MFLVYILEGGVPFRVGKVLLLIMYWQDSYTAKHGRSTPVKSPHLGHGEAGNQPYTKRHRAFSLLGQDVFETNGQHKGWESDHTWKKSVHGR
jgi:hypothetical protein